MEEKELVSLLKQKDRAAFKIMVDQWQSMVFNTALGILQNEEDAEDTAQEVFIKVYETVDQFKEASKLSTWIYRITVTKSLDAIRKKKRKKRFAFLSSLYSNEGELIREPPDWHHPGVLAEQREDATLLFRAMDKLAPNQKTAFVLNKIEMLPYREVAEIMQMSESAVDSLLHRAKSNIKKQLSSIMGEDKPSKTKI